MEEFCGSSFWDWNLTWYTDNPDFTPCFQRTVLTFVPCVFLFVFASLDIYFSFLWPSPKALPWTALNVAKLGLTTLLILLEFGRILVSWENLWNSETEHVAYPVDLYVPLIRATTLVLSIILLLYSKKHGVPRSGIQFLFWFFLSLVQAIRFRTVLLQNFNPAPQQTLYEFVSEVIYFPVVLGQFILHCWADFSPNSYHNTSNNLKDCAKSSIAPELLCSFPSQFLFQWFAPLTWKGFKKPLEYSDLWEISPLLRCSYAVPRFDYYWPSNLNPKSAQQSHRNDAKIRKRDKAAVIGGVLSTCLKAYGFDFVFACVIRAIPEVLVFISPQILKLLIDFTGSQDEPQWKGFLYATCLLVVAVTSCLFGAYGIHLLTHVGLNVKSALVSAVYRKSLLLSNSARRDQSTGEIVNRMGADVQRQSDLVLLINYLMKSPFAVAAALYFLWNILGVAALAGVAIMLLVLPLSALVANKVQKLQRAQLAEKDKRIKLCHEILSGIKAIKLYAWEPSFQRLVDQIRKKEITLLKQKAYWNALADFLANCAPFMIALSTFGAWLLIDSNRVLDATTAFVSLSLFNILSQNLRFFPIDLPNIIQHLVAAERLNGFMNSEEIDLDCVSHCPNQTNPVVIENGSFAWTADNKNGDTLSNINLTVRQGQLVAIVGPVGSGKSSLLSALLNELYKTGGSANINGPIAYVAQQAWIQNATIRDNILFGRPYNSSQYAKVVKACALQPDLELFPSGDKTEIGEKGINLSGGQKQRVSLARAVYSNAEIFLLDDPLSAVDAHVGKHIFDKVIGPKGLLQRKTRLLVTHSIVHLPAVNNIVVMNNGQISEQGSYSKLQENSGAFAHFLKSHTTEETQIDLEKSHSGSESDSDTDSISSATAERSKLVQEEKPETKQVKSSVYISYFQSAGWLYTLGSLLLYFTFQSFSVGANFWLSNWVSIHSIKTDNALYLSVYGLLGGLQAISILLAAVIMALGALRSAQALHRTTLARILQAPLQFFDVTPSGRIINRLSQDVDTLDNALPLILRFLLNGAFNVLAILFVISISTPLFALLIIPIGLAYYFIQRFYIATSRQLKRLESVSKSPIYSHFGESIAGASTIRAYGQEERFIQELESKQDHNAVSYYHLVVSNRWLQIRLELMGNAVVFFAALFAVLGRDTLSQGTVGLSVSYSLQITMALLILVRFTSDVESNIVAVERLQEYGELEQEAPWKVDSFRVGSGWPKEGQVEFEEYQARYRADLELVLNGVSCRINGGEKVGIVGRTGAGKSSLTLGIFRIVEAAGGRILVDGQDIGKMGLHDLRRKLSIIPQEPVLFSGSLKLNLDPFEEQGDTELWRALELAHLADFVKELPPGLNYQVAEGGENLSVGQRQLLCLARALLRKTKILVLDEATSAVDLDTEQLILKTVREEFGNATVITIAHRLNTIMDSDRVLVMEKGVIYESGTPSDLLKNKSSIFYSLGKEAGLVG